MEQPEPHDGDQPCAEPPGHEQSGANPASYGESFADVYDDWYGELSTEVELADMVQCLMALTSAKRPVILELGAGTGRLALPLATAGATVIALDGSADMLAQMAGKMRPRASGLVALGADMAQLPLAPSCVDAAFVAYNTFFNLDTEADQRECLQDVARVLSPGGFLAIEAFTPVTDHGDHAPSVTRSPVSTTDRPVFVASRVDPVAQQIRGAHLDLGPQGLRLRPWRVRYMTPDQLDQMAADVDLTLEHRWNAWDRTSFDGRAGQHVSVYRN